MSFARATASVTSPVVIDLTACGFLDSTGLRVILQTQQRTDASLAIACTPRSAPTRILQLTFRNLVPIHPSVEAAVNAV